MTVYFADDDESIRALVTDFLRELGYQVDVFEHGKALLDAVRRQPPDLLIVDLRMPVMDGFEVLDTLNAEGLRQFPAIAFSAIAGLDDPRYAARIGAEAFLAKPFSLEKLEQTVREVTAGRVAAG